jgi:hypothetical protein
VTARLNRSRCSMEAARCWPALIEVHTNDSTCASYGFVYAVCVFAVYFVSHAILICMHATETAFVYSLYKDGANHWFHSEL